MKFQSNKNNKREMSETRNKKRLLKELSSRPMCEQSEDKRQTAENPSSTQAAPVGDRN